MTLYITNSKGGEMTPLDLSRLSQPPTRTKHNRPVRRTYRRRLAMVNEWALIVTGIVCGCLAMVASAL